MSLSLFLILVLIISVAVCLIDTAPLIHPFGKQILKTVLLLVAIIFLLRLLGVAFKEFRL